LRRSVVDTKELVEGLNRLLEAERAGVVVMNDLAKDEDDGAVKERLIEIRSDEGKYCAGLVGMIKERGEAPTDKTGDFVGKVRALEKKEEKLSLLIRGQEWVVRKVKEIPLELLEAPEREFVSDMIEGHEVNIAYVRSLIE
jgi:nitronate monooxygenase